MNHNLFNNRGEVATLVVVGLLVLVGVATFLTTTLNQDRKTTSTRASDSCTYDSGASIPLGQTETDASNAENRVPISSNRYYYDTLGDMSAFRKVDNQEVLGMPAGSGKTDANVQNMMSKMFSYKPSKLTAAYLPPSENDNYILEIPVDNSTTITMPSLGAYNIGGGYVAMVTFAADDRVTLHVGRHEYFTGTKTCKNGETCSGGYWIYIKGLCVDKQIVNAYNGVKSAQEAAGADLNPIQLPMIRPGHILGKANSSSVFVGVRDNGQFISIHRDFYWGSAPIKDISSGGSTNPTSPAGQTATPTPKPGITCGQPGLQCCTPQNPDTASVGAACVTGSVCVGGECVAHTPTPTPPTTQSTPTITPTPTKAPAQCNNVAIDGAVIKYNDENKISFFRVTHNTSDNYGPKVTFASQNGNKASTIHIDGPSWGESQWEPGKFGDIPFGKGTKKYFYLEIQLKTTDGSTVICAEKVVQCERTESTKPNTEIECGPISQSRASETTFRTNENVNTSAETVIYEGKPVLIL
ncbi:hypothetical protein KBD81_01275 [Candidatus Woesebacteria bacterium]|nr:hypothetical protein [Candidatus Woesebacteria bacterium]